MIYLASPYSHISTAVMQQRYEDAARYTSFHLRIGICLFSPIVYGHQIAIDYNLPGDAGFWRELNESLLIRCDCMWVLKLEGWEHSAGVLSEIALAEEMGIEIKYREPLGK